VKNNIRLHSKTTKAYATPYINIASAFEATHVEIEQIAYNIKITVR
jgi:hypothetical protein